MSWQDTDYGLLCSTVTPREEDDDEEEEGRRGSLVRPSLISADGSVIMIISFFGGH